MDSAAIGSSDFLFTCVRENNAQTRYYKDKTASNLISRSSIDMVDREVFLGANNKAGTGATTFSADTIGLFYAGSALDATDVQVINDGVAVAYKAINRAINVAATITVGVGKNYTTIQAAIEKAVSGNTIVVDAATYNEPLKIKKNVRIVGTGRLETILHFYETGNSVNHYYSLDLTHDCSFDNVLIRKKSDNQTGSNVQIVRASGCDADFTDCKILLAATDYVGTIVKFGALKIENGANVNFDGVIDCVANTTDTQNIIISETSTFIFTGSKFKSRILAKNDSITNITADEFYIWNDYATIKLYEASRVTLNNTTQTGFDTGSDAAASAYSNILQVATLFNTSTFTLIGDIKGQIIIDNATAANLNLTNITGNQGRLWISNTGTVVNTNKITLTNCDIFFDYNNNVSGFHILEDNQSSEWIILDSVLEFSGYTGEYETMGNPIVMYGANSKITIKRSTIVDNVNDGNNYLSTIWAKNIFDFEDVIITNRNWDGVAASRNLVITKAAGQHIQGRMVNVTFNNPCNIAPINFVSAGQTLDGDDYIIAENVTNNSTAAIFAIDGIENVAAWNTLLANAPV